MAKTIIISAEQMLKVIKAYDPQTHLSITDCACCEIDEVSRYIAGFYRKRNFDRVCADVEEKMRELSLIS